MDDNEIKWLIALVIAAAAVAAAWFFWDGSEPPAEPLPVREEASATEPVPAEPVHPVEPLDAAPGEGELVELPPLEESDRYFALELVDIFGPELEALLADEALIDKSVAAVDNLMQSRVAEKIRPLGRLSGSFVVTTAGDNGTFQLSPDNYDRYTDLVDMLTGADVDELVTSYRRFYPLLQEAYTQLGYPDAYFNDPAGAGIDHLLAKPEPEEPVRLIQPHVLYLFADPELEELSGGQKLLLRMGPDHAARTKAFLTELRERIAQPAP